MVSYDLLGEKKQAFLGHPIAACDDKHIIFEQLTSHFTVHIQEI